MRWNIYIKLVFSVLFIVCSLTALAQDKPIGFSMDGKNVYLEIKSYATPALRDSVLIGCGFDSAALNRLMVGLKSEQDWVVSSLESMNIVLSRDIKSMSNMNMGIGQIQMEDGEAKWEPSGAVSAFFAYDESPISSIEIGEEHKITIKLADHEEAKEVFLSGSFNAWSTLKHPMTKQNGYWETTLDLQPGVYDYKFIVDGEWKLDPKNDNKRNDGFGNVNSRFVVPNHTFFLNDFQDARKVIVTGSFNDWNEKQVKMIARKEGWSLPVYLKEGTYTYKFIVNGKDWILDPSNPKTRNDGAGNENSVLEIGDPYVFELKGFENAKKVVLSGSFNNWNTEELAMEQTTKGWQLPYVLAEGNFEYKFIVDGKWILDPTNPITIGEGEYQNSVLVIKPNYEFRLAGFANAKKVELSGSFNLWAEPGYSMVQKDGVWTFPIHLWPAKYTYKFKVDGKWIIDPANQLREHNEYGSFNSVLWIGH